MLVGGHFGKAGFDECGNQVTHAVLRDVEGCFDLDRAHWSKSGEHPVETWRAGGRPQAGNGCLHILHGRIGRFEQPGQPLRGAAGGIGNKNSALAGPEFGSERFGADRCGEGEGPGSRVAERDRRARHEIERP